jgi:alpha-D-xyloside xylohydrolase
MLASGLLVAPIFNGDGKAEFYLPEGEWIDFFRDDILRGGR